MTESKNHPPAKSNVRVDAAADAPAGTRPDGTPVGGTRPDTASDDAIRARSEAAFNEARAAGDPNRDLRGTPAGDVLDQVTELVQRAGDDAARRRVLRAVAQSCGIDINTLATDPGPAR